MTVNHCVESSQFVKKKCSGMFLLKSLGRYGIIVPALPLSDANHSRAKDFRCLNANCIQCVKTDLSWLEVYEGKQGCVIFTSA